MGGPETSGDLWKADLGQPVCSQPLYCLISYVFLIDLSYILATISRTGVLSLCNNIIIAFQDTVLEELSLYDAGSQTPYWPGLNFRRQRSFYWWPGSATARQVFDVSYRVSEVMICFTNVVM